MIAYETLCEALAGRDPGPITRGAAPPPQDATRGRTLQGGFAAGSLHDDLDPPSALETAEFHSTDLPGIAEPVGEVDFTGANEAPEVYSEATVVSMGNETETLTGKK